MKHAAPLAFALSFVAPACGESVAGKGSAVDDAAYRAQDAGGGAGGQAEPGGAPGTPDAAVAPGADASGGTPLSADAAPSPKADAAGAPDPDAEVPAPDAATPPPPECPEPELGEVSDWRHGVASPLTVGLGIPQHSAVEPIVNPGAALEVAGKFAYGVVSKDLEDEDVELFVRLPGADDCGAWASVGVATTNRDGRATVSVDPALVPDPGHYDFRFVVQGDHTDARGALWVVEPGTAFVLFDVDGTLTIGDSEIFQQVLLGQDPEMYEAADEVARTYADAGYQPLYVTGRPYFLNPATRNWLIEKDFPQGPVRTTDNMEQVLPTAGGVQTYKREYLLALFAGAGIEIPYAYGNASTDICAYAQAGLDPQTTFIIGPNGGDACDGFAPSQALVDYPSHLPSLANLPPAP